MPNVVVANTTPQLQGQHLITAEGGNPNVSGLIAFNRGTSPPFAVNAGADKVLNLYADRAATTDVATSALNGAQPWVAIPFAPANFAIDGGGPWSPTVLLNQYVKIGPLVIWQFGASPVALSQATTNLFIGNLPFGITGAQAFSPLAWSPQPGYLRAAAPNSVTLLRVDTQPWAAAGSFAMYFTAILPVAG